MEYLVFGENCVFVFVDFFKIYYFYIVKRIGGICYIKCLCIVIILLYLSGSVGNVFEYSMISIIILKLKK